MLGPPCPAILPGAVHRHTPPRKTRTPGLPSATRACPCCTVSRRAEQALFPATSGSTARPFDPATLPRRPGDSPHDGRPPRRPDPHPAEVRSRERLTTVICSGVVSQLYFHSGSCRASHTKAPTATAQSGSSWRGRPSFSFRRHNAGISR